MNINTNERGPSFKKFKLTQREHDAMRMTASVLECMAQNDNYEPHQKYLTEIREKIKGLAEKYGPTKKAKVETGTEEKPPAKK